MSKYIYAIRDTKTGKLVNAKCGKNGKFYLIKSYAEKRCLELNKYTNRHEVVTFELKEVKTT